MQVENLQKLKKTALNIRLDNELKEGIESLISTLLSMPDELKDDFIDIFNSSPCCKVLLPDNKQT